MKLLFTEKKMGIEEAINTTVLKFQAGYTDVVARTDFGTVIVDLRRSNACSVWKYRVLTYEPNEAPMKSKIVRRWIQPGFDYYFSVSFAIGANLFDNETLLRYFVSIGMWTAMADYIAKQTNKTVAARNIGEVAAYVYMKCKYDFNCDRIGRQIVRSNYPAAFPVSSEKISLMVENVRYYTKDLDCMVSGCSRTSDKLCIYSEFWSVFTALMIEYSGQYRYPKSVYGAAYDESIERHYLNEVEFLTLWIGYIDQIGLDKNTGKETEKDTEKETKTQPDKKSKGGKAHAKN